MGEWKETTIGELLTLQRGHDLVQTEFVDGGYLVAGSNGPIGNHNKFTTKGPGLTIGRSGNSIGVAHFYENDFWAHNTVLYSKVFHNSYPKFVYFLLKSFAFKSFDGGSAVPTLNRNHVHPTSISVPVDIEEQKSIAAILSCFDDKINLLHRQNKTLEQLAETLFRLWFDEEAEERWEKRPLSSIANFLNGLACQKFPPENIVDRLPVLKIKELNSGISENSDLASTDIKPQYIVKNGDVIFAWSASLMVKIWNGQDCILNQHLFKVTSKVYPKWFYYLWCKHHLAEFISISESHATTMGHIKRSDLEEAMCFVAPKTVLQKMSIIIEPIFDKMINNYKQIHTLTQLRDTLLPKLMSGEVGVKM